MMKRYTIMVIALLCAIAVVADPVTRSNARQIADQFLQKKGKSVKASPVRAPRMKGQTTSTSDNAAYYVFNSSDDKGFVIVSGDDQTAPVLGYSLNGKFDEATLPANLRAWLEDYARQIEVIAAGKGRPARVPIHSESIAQKMTTTWNQDVPYNNMCVFDGVRTMTGCVATAISQVLFWNKYPQKVTAIPGYVTSPEDDTKPALTIDALPIGDLDWYNMLNHYNVDEAKICHDPEVNQKAVATLMRYVGQGAQMEYSADESGTTLSQALHGLVTYFGYDSSARIEAASTYSLEGWDNLIYEELKERPVVFGAQASDGGHAFVIDGYDSSDGTYYVNWGWGGDYDGQYLLRVLNPDGGGIGSSATNDGYSISQEAIIGLTHGWTMESGRYLRGVLGCDSALEDPNGNTTTEDKPFLAFGYRNPYFETVSFDLGMAFLDDEGNIIEDKTAVIISDMAVDADGEDISIYFLLSNAFGMVPDNQYTLVPVSREHGDTEWHKMFDEKYYFEVDYTDADHYEVITHPNEQIEIVEVSVEGSLKAYDEHTYSVTIKNTGEEFSEPLSFFMLAPGEYEPRMVSAAQVTLEPDEEKTYSFAFTPSTEGTYQLYMSTDQEGSPRLEGSEKEVTIEGVKLADVEGKSANYGNDGNKLYITIQNNTEDKTYASAFMVQVFLIEDDETTLVAQAQSPFLNNNDTYYIQPNSSKAIPFDLGTTTLGEGMYMTDIYYASSFAGNTLDKKIMFFFTIDNTGHTPTGIENVNGNVNGNDNAIYDLSGRKVADGNYALPKGIYIQNGRKVVIK